MVSLPDNILRNIVQHFINGSCLIIVYTIRLDNLHTIYNKFPY